jgi:hypothetical protein
VNILYFKRLFRFHGTSLQNKLWRPCKVKVLYKWRHALQVASNLINKIPIFGETKNVNFSYSCHEVIQGN